MTLELLSLIISSISLIVAFISLFIAKSISKSVNKNDSSMSQKKTKNSLQVRTIKLDK
jgi:hypothetical protein